MKLTKNCTYKQIKLAMYLKGTSLRKIAKEVNIKYLTVRNLLIKKTNKPEKREIIINFINSLPKL